MPPGLALRCARPTRGRDNGTGGEIGGPLPYLDQAVEESEHIRTTAEGDAAAESAVLQQVLALHPVMITMDELVRELGEQADAAGREAVERSVRDLTAAGLLHRSGSFVLPSRAALRFEQLLGG